MGKSWEIWGAILHVVAQSISSWLSFPVSQCWLWPLRGRVVCWVLLAPK